MYGVSDIIFLFANWNIWYHGSTSAQTMLDFLQQQLLLFCTQQLHSLQNVSTETEEILIGLVLIVSFNWFLCGDKSSPIKTKKQRRRKEAQKTVKYGISWKVLKYKNPLYNKKSSFMYLLTLSIFCETMFEYFMFFSHSFQLQSPTHASNWVRSGNYLISRKFKHSFQIICCLNLCRVNPLPSKLS